MALKRKAESECFGLATLQDWMGVLRKQGLGQWGCWGEVQHPFFSVFGLN